MEKQFRQIITNPIVASLAVGMFFAGFTQSCGVTKASISKTIVAAANNQQPAKEEALKKPENDTERKSIVITSKVVSHVDSTIVSKPMVVLPDTSFDSPTIYNERLSLENSRKIIDMLIAKDNELKGLRDTVAKLSARTTVTKNQKIDAVSMEAVWKMGQYILTAGCIIILMMFINIIILLNNKKYRTVQTIS